MEADTLVRIIGTPLCLAGIYLGWRLSRTNFAALSQKPQIPIGIAVLSAAVFWKMLALAGFIGVPAATVAVANYHTFEGVHRVEACASCHVMRPMVNDMIDVNGETETLAARHFRNNWIPHDQCFHCHSDYGLSGDLEAKMTGFRHLARYTSATYHEPIIGRTSYNNQNCYKCHGEAPRFNAVKSHHTAEDFLKSNQMSCLNCHGPAHPSRAARTPGSEQYDALMEAPVRQSHQRRVFPPIR
jgi:hypothetical protein